MEDTPIDLSTAFFKMMLSLGLLIGLIFITIYLLKRMMRARVLKHGPEERIRILDRRSISPKTALYIIEADGEKMVMAESSLEVKLYPLKDTIREE